MFKRRKSLPEPTFRDGAAPYGNGLRKVLNGSDQKGIRINQKPIAQKRCFAISSLLGQSRQRTREV